MDVFGTGDGFDLGALGGEAGWKRPAGAKKRLVYDMPLGFHIAILHVGKFEAFTTDNY